MELAEVVGQLGAVRRFPVRSLGGESPDEALVSGSGLVGDRFYDLFDEELGVPLTTENAPFLLRYRARFLDPMVKAGDLEPWIRVRTPEGVEAALNDRSWIEDISRRCGRPVRLRARPDVEADPGPLLLLSVPTLRFLEKQYGGPLEAMRVRANLIVELPDGRPFEEDRWVGRQIWVGDVLLELANASSRCLVASLDAETPEHAPGVLAAILRGRGGLLGVHARAMAGTRLRVGDPIALVD